MQQPTVSSVRLTLGCLPRACSCRTCHGDTFHRWATLPPLPGALCAQGSHGILVSSTSLAPRAQLEVRLQSPGPLLPRGMSWSLEPQGLGSSSIHWAGWQKCPLSPEGSVASGGPSRKMLRVCLAPRMSSMNVAHCPHPGVALAALGLGPCPSNLCLRGPVASSCLCVSLLSLTRTLVIRFRAQLGNPAKTPFPNKVTFMAWGKPPVALSRMRE